MTTQDCQKPANGDRAMTAQDQELLPSRAEITLTWDQVTYAAKVGLMRTIESRKRGLKPSTYGIDKRSQWDHDRTGAIAEYAAALLLEEEWSASINNFSGPDVGEWLIRQTHHEGGHLIVRPRPNDETHGDAVYLLMIGELQHWRCAGGMWGRVAMHNQFWRSDWDAWLVPQALLRLPTRLQEPEA